MPQPATASASTTTPPAAGRAIWRPAVGTTWQIQFTGAVNTSVDAQVFDLDGETTSAATVSTLHAAGRKVICYVDAGSYEDFRADAGSFPAGVLGASNGWPGERWLDIRQVAVLQPILARRIETCRSKGFDAIDPDNLDGYANDTGFPLTAADQLAFNRAVAALAHSAGLAVGLKNDLDQVAALEPAFDFAVNEQCYQYAECDVLQPFVRAGKAVFGIEYSVPTSRFCAPSTAAGYSTIRKNLSLDAAREVC